MILEVGVRRYRVGVVLVGQVTKRYRGLMGEGCIPLKQIRGWIEETGFNGFIEVEIFSNTWWKEDQSEFLNKIVKAYKAHV